MEIKESTFKVILLEEGVDKANQIIRAVNAHDELISALKDIAEHGRRPLNGGDKRPFAYRHEEMAALAEAAIKKAEGR